MENEPIVSPPAHWLARCAPWLLLWVAAPMPLWIALVMAMFYGR